MTRENLAAVLPLGGTVGIANAPKGGFSISLLSAVKGIVMSSFLRRDLLAGAAAIAAAATMGFMRSEEAAGGDASFTNNIPDPLLSGTELPAFKFALEKSKAKVIGKKSTCPNGSQAIRRTGCPRTSANRRPSLTSSHIRTCSLPTRNNPGSKEFTVDNRPCVLIWLWLLSSGCARVKETVRTVPFLRFERQRRVSQTPNREVIAMQVIDPVVDEAIDHRVRAFLKKLNSPGGKPVDELSPRDARQVLVGLQASTTTEMPPAKVSSVSISYDGQQLDLTVVRPAGAEKTVPAFMFFHGGGWVLGDFPTHERLVRDLVAFSGMRLCL